MNEQLVSWVERQLDADYTEEQVRATLAEQGYDDDVIDDVIQQARAEQQQEDLDDDTDEEFLSWWSLAIVQMLLEPTQFFQTRGKERRFSRTTLFWAMNMLVIGLLMVIPFLILGTSLTDLTGNIPLLGNLLNTAGIMVLAVPLIFLFLGTVTGVIHNIINAALLHICYKLMGGDGKFGDAYSVLMYLSGPFAVAALPVAVLSPLGLLPNGLIIYGIAAGIVIGVTCLYNFYLVAIGKSIKYGIPKTKALLPLVIVALIIVGLQFV